MKQVFSNISLKENEIEYYLSVFGFFCGFAGNAVKDRLLLVIELFGHWWVVLKRQTIRYFSWVEPPKPYDLYFHVFSKIENFWILYYSNGIKGKLLQYVFHGLSPLYFMTHIFMIEIFWISESQMVFLAISNLFHIVVSRKSNFGLETFGLGWKYQGCTLAFFINYYCLSKYWNE